MFVPLERRSRTISCWYNMAKLQRGFDSAQPDQPFLSITKV